MRDRAEFEYGWLAFGFLLGVGYLVQPPATVRLLLPAWFTYVWAAAFLIGALAGTWGAWVEQRRSLDTHRYWPLAAERAGLGLHVGAVSTLGVAVVYIWLHVPVVDGVRVPFPVLALSMVAVWMAVAIRRIVRVTRAIKTMTTNGEGEGSDGR